MRGRAGTSLRRTLARAFALGVALLLVMGIGGLAAVTATTRSVDELTRRVQPEELANAELLAAVSEASRGLRGYLLSRDRRFLEAYDRGRANYPEALGRLRALQSADESALVDQQAQLAEEYFRHYRGVPSRRPSQDEAQRLLDGGKAILDRFVAANEGLTVALRAKEREIEARNDRVRRALLLALAGLGTLGVAVASWVGLRTTRYVTAPLGALRDTLGRLSAGDRSVRVPPDPRAPIEVQEVAASINRLAAESQRLHLAEQERARMREAAAAAGRRTQEHLGLDAVLNAGVEAVGQALHADRAYVWRVGEDRTGWVQRQWSAPGVPPLTTGGEGPVWPFPQAPHAWVRELRLRRGSLVVHDTAREPRLQTPVGRRALAVTNSKSLIMVPLTAGADVYGVLTVAAVCSPRRWTGAEAELAEAVAADLGRALHRAQLFEQQRELVEQLRELDRTKTDFLSTVSHELRTPLTSISGYVELIRDGDVGPVTPEQDRMLDVVDRNTRRLRGLIEDLLTLSRIEAGAVSSRLEPVDVAGLMGAAADTMRPAVASAGLTLNVELGWETEHPVRVLGDHDQLERVLINLLSNAVKFSSPGGTVGLAANLEPAAPESATPEPAALVLTVSDTGIGIPAKDQQQLFSRFFRASNATARAIQGTGLGLTIVRSIVERHGGHLDLQSAEGVGTTVRLHLPVLADGDAAPVPSAPAAVAAAPAAGNAR